MEQSSKITAEQADNLIPKNLNDPYLDDMYSHFSAEISKIDREIKDQDEIAIQLANLLFSKNNYFVYIEDRQENMVELKDTQFENVSQITS